MKVKELAEYLNGLKITQKSGYLDDEFENSLPVHIYEKYFKNNEVDFDLYLNKHRWYETSTTIYEIDGEYLGCIYVSKVYSESMDVGDVGHQLYFCEYEPIATITYIPVL